ncbi:MAG: DUF4249 domain-containing protein [Candidatus Azobacteroides sp.]|nr:DUF4249 domain-containing protein [Candidatus Azobacteroides sp.]
MKSWIITLTGWMLIASALYACVQELPFDVKETELPVVNCILTNDTLQTLSLTQSVKITDGYAFQEIQEARISLWAEEVKIGEFERKSYGNWQLRYQPEAGIHYRLQVQLPDGKELTATTAMPEKTQLTADREKNSYPSKYFRQLTAENPCWVFILGEETWAADLMHPVPSSKVKLHEIIGTDHPRVDRFNEEGNLVDLVSRATTPAYAYYVRIQPSPVSNEEGIPFCMQTNFGPYGFIFFRTASEEYDQYLKSSLQKLFVYKSEDDPIQWFDENKVYSNISNGAGIFAAYQDNYYYFFDNYDFFNDEYH